MTKKMKIIAGVIGDPISHSLSPRLHGYWIDKYSINGEYNAYHVCPAELHVFIKSLRDNGISGVNITLPHKEEALKLVDEIDEKAKKIGAVNTIYFEKNKIIGSNTDGIGFLAHLKQTSRIWRAENGPAVVIGAGGAARAVLVSLLEDGVPEIRLINRTKKRAERLANDISDDRICIHDWDDRADALKNTALLVNVTTLGMTGQRPLELSLENLPVNACVYDIVYSPLETNLLKKARIRGNETIDGLGMLLHQAVPGFSIWFGTDPEVDKGLKEYMLKALT